MRATASAWREVAVPSVLPPAEVSRALLLDAGDWFGAGNGYAAYPVLAQQLALVQKDAEARPSARAIGELALPRLAAGEAVRAADALPLYVRHRVALTTAEQDAGILL